MEPGGAFTVGDWVRTLPIAQVQWWGRITSIVAVSGTRQRWIVKAVVSSINTGHYEFYETGFESFELEPLEPTEEHLYLWSLAELSR